MSSDDLRREHDGSGRMLLVLGSAGNSKPGLYRAAQRRGLSVVLVKAAPAGWERRLCADILPVDCGNYQDLDEVVPSVVDFARAHRADGLITTFDAAVPVLAEAAARLGLVGIPPRTAAVLRDKFLMREYFRKLGCRRPRAFSCALSRRRLRRQRRSGSRWWSNR